MQPRHAQTCGLGLICGLLGNERILALWENPVHPRHPGGAASPHLYAPTCRVHPLRSQRRRLRSMGGGVQDRGCGAAAVGRTLWPYATTRRPSEAESAVTGPASSRRYTACSCHCSTSVPSAVCERRRSAENRCTAPCEDQSSVTRHPTPATTNTAVDGPASPEAGTLSFTCMSMLCVLTSLVRGPAAPSVRPAHSADASQQGERAME